MKKKFKIKPSKSKNYVEKYDWGGGIEGGLQGLFTGTSAGAAFGPYGALAGAVLGAGLGAYKGSAEEDKEAKMKRDQLLQFQYSQRFMKKGGEVMNEDMLSPYDELFQSNDKKTIEVESNELEVKNGKIIKDFKGKKSHNEGGYTYNATTGNTIIPSNMRDKYLEGDKLTRVTLEQNLRKDQLKRDNEELNSYREFFKKGGKIKKYEDGGNTEEYDFMKDVISKKSILNENNSPEYMNNKTITSLPNVKYNNEIQGFGDINNPKLKTINDNSSLPPKSNNFDFNKAAYLTSTVAPIAYDLYRGLDNYDMLNHEDYQNPYENKSKELMSRRNINMKAIRDRILSNRTNALNSIKNSQGLSSGSYLTNAAQIEANTQNAYSDALLKEQDYNNRYRAEEANILGNLGQSRASTKLSIKDINDRNKAARNTMTAKGLEGVSKLGQGLRNDDIRMSLLDDVLNDYEYNPKLKKFVYKRK